MTSLGLKVEHARGLKAKVSEIHSSLMKGVLPEANVDLMKSLKVYLADYINAVSSLPTLDDCAPGYLKTNVDI